MSKVLIIRHLPSGLTFQEKEQLLKYFGAVNVWENKSKRNYVFAAFSTVEQAKSSLLRLHQLEIAQRRLVVEFSKESHSEHVSKLSDEQNAAITKNITEFLCKLNAWNPSVNFHQPPPPHLKYLYPEPQLNILINIIYSMLTHKPLYIQVLHLMNKMCLDSPFQYNEKAEKVVKDMFRELFVQEVSLIPQPPSEPESEISSDEINQNTQKKALPRIKRKQLLPKTRKRPAAVLSTANLPKPKKKVVNKEVFEEVSVVEPKKISVVVPENIAKIVEPENEVVGQIGKFQKVDKPVENNEEASAEVDRPTISKKELLQNRVSYRDMKILPVFKNYHPGPPSMRLYIKNLAKTVTEQDVKRIYRRYVEDLSEIEQIGFDVRIMQEGRMKGQGFVTFPSVELAELALNETNGFILKDKPMVVQFARAANKKPVE